MERTFTDMLGRSVKMVWPPGRIVSVVPSQTELLADLGLEQEVVGITKFCVHPEAWFRSKARVGGTKQLHIDRIVALQPDLIIANKEENVREQIEELSQRFPVWVSNVENVADALHMIRQIGEVVGRFTRAEELAGQIQRAFAQWKPPKRMTAAYFIWRKPWMVAGGDTFIHHMMYLAGFENAFSDKRRYPQVSATDIENARPEVLLLSSEPYPFKSLHAEELKAIYPHAHPILVDGEMFSWYGSRMLYAVPYFKQLWNELEKSVPST